MEQGPLSKKTAPTAQLGAPGAVGGMGGERDQTSAFTPHSWEVREGPKLLRDDMTRKLRS